MPPAKREIIKAGILKIRGDLQGLYQQISAARNAAAKRLGADPFDQAAYMEQVENVQKLRSQIGVKIAIEIAGLAKQLSPDERLAFADMTRHMSIKDYMGNDDASTR